MKLVQSLALLFLIGSVERSAETKGPYDPACAVGTSVAFSMKTKKLKADQLMDLAIENCMKCTFRCLCNTKYLWSDIERCANSDPTLQERPNSDHHLSESVTIPNHKKASLIDRNDLLYKKIGLWFTDKDVKIDAESKMFTPIKYIVGGVKKSTFVLGALRYPKLENNIPRVVFYRLNIIGNVHNDTNDEYIRLELWKVAYYVVLENHGFMMPYLRELHKKELENAGTGATSIPTQAT